MKTNLHITEYLNHKPEDEVLADGHHEVWQPSRLGQRNVSLVEFIKNGGWFCERCERVVNLPLDLDEPARCPHCKKPTCKYHHPVKELQTV